MKLIALDSNHNARTALLVLNADERSWSGAIQLIGVTRPARTPRRPSITDEYGH